MAWQTITHKCGHDQRHQLYGKHDARDSKAAWLAKGVCKECYAAEQAAKVAEASVGLPELTGSPKQIAWAEKIRVDLLAKIDAVVADFAGRTPQPQDAEKFVAIVKALGEVRDETASETAAKWWIDNREMASAQAWMHARLQDRGAI